MVRKHAKNFANALTFKEYPALRWDGARGERIRLQIFPQLRNKIAGRYFINSSILLQNRNSADC
jgi:hypothetical protein